MKKYQVVRFAKWSILPALLSMTLLITSAFAASTSNVAGDWEGAVNTGSTSLRIVIHVAQDKDGKLTATMDSPDQGATGIAISTISFKQPDLHFEIERFNCSYDGKISDTGSAIEGTWKQGSASLPLTFKSARK
jgi:uncharacterized protein